VPVSAVGDQSEMRREQLNFELRGRAFGYWLGLQGGDGLLFGKYSTRTAELNEILGQQIDQILQTVNAGLEEAKLQLL